MVVFGTTFDLQGQISDVCSFGKSLAGIEGALNTVVREICGAQTDCIFNSFEKSLTSGTKYLNGYNTGARYDGMLYGYVLNSENLD
jgi:hypothetical protein